MERAVSLIDRVERSLLFAVVGGADLGRAFEGHVLEHMSKTGEAGRVVRASGVCVSVEGNHGRMVALKDDEVHPVVECEFGDGLLETRKILRPAGGQQDAPEKQRTYRSARKQLHTSEGSSVGERKAKRIRAQPRDGEVFASSRLFFLGANCRPNDSVRGGVREGS